MGVPGNREEQARARALRGGRAPSGAGRLAARPVLALRGRSDVLGAGRDGQGAGRHPRRRRPRGGRAEARARRSPTLGAVAAPATGRPAGGKEGSGDARGEAFAAWRRFFEELAADRPLVLVFEDMHWADDNLLEFVDQLVEWVSGVRLLVVCTARPELLTRTAGWGGGKPNALTISLSSLSDEDTARLIAELPGYVLPAETQAELLTRAGGNPLYAEEFTRMIRDRGSGRDASRDGAGADRCADRPARARAEGADPGRGSRRQALLGRGARLALGRAPAVSGGDASTPRAEGVHPP